MRVSLKKKIIHLKSDTASCRCKNFSLKQATGLMGGGGGSRPSPGSATVTRIQSASFNGQRPKTTATLHQESLEKRRKADAKFSFALLSFPGPWLCSILSLFYGASL